MSRKQESSDDIIWFINVFEEASVGDGVVAADVLLRAPTGHRKLHGYVVSDTLAPAVGKYVDHNDFCITDEEALALLCQLFDYFRGELLEFGGGGSTLLNRDQWLAWLDEMYPGQAEKIESQLLVHITEIP